jgi:hypothetical protein
VRGLIFGRWWLMARKWRVGSGLRNENTFGGMKTDCILSKK